MLAIAGFGAPLSPLPDLRIKHYEFHHLFSTKRCEMQRFHWPGSRGKKN
jgi:hypothetical protein